MKRRYLVRPTQPLRADLQRGEDANRPPRRGFRLPGVQRPPLPGQAADQAIQGGLATASGTARRRDVGSARVQRRSSDHTTEPDQSGMVGLLPNEGGQPGIRQAGQSPVDAHLQVGEPEPLEQTEMLGCRPVLRPVQPIQEGQVGFRRPDIGAYLLRFSWTKIVRHQLVPGTASPDDPALADYWAKRRQRRTPPLDSVSLGLLKTSTWPLPTL